MVNGKVAIVTGGTQGIGKGIADTLADNGATVVVSARHEADTDHQFIACDVTDRKQVDALVDQVVEEHGTVDILINNAGVYPFTPFTEMSEDEWDTVVAVNLKGVFNCTQAALPHMIEQERGKIVNLASIAGAEVGFPNVVHYSATKAGVKGMTRSLALEVADHNITVNAIAPGPIRTPGLDERLDQETLDHIIETVPEGRAGTPTDISSTALFLASEQSDYITGQTIVVDGGFTDR